MAEVDRIDGEFDDILGKDVPEKYKKTSINRKLIEAYERVIANDAAETAKEEDEKRAFERFKKQKEPEFGITADGIWYRNENICDKF